MKTESNSIGLSRSLVTERGKKKDVLYNTNYLQLRNSNAVIYSFNELSHVKQNEMNLRLAIARKDTYQGVLSPASQKLIRKKIECWFNAIVFENSKKVNVTNFKIIKPVFLTVTLSASQRHCDQDIKKEILKPFLRVLREQYGCARYVWKAEKQENGNIHFHILVDQYIRKEIVNELWNTAQEKLCYVSRFEDKYKHRKPPSSKVEVVRSWQEMSRYIEKYIAKDEKGKTIEGAIWKASKKLMSLEYFELVVDNSLSSTICQLERENKIKVIVKDRYSLILPQNFDVKLLVLRYHSELYRSYMNDVSVYLFNNEEFNDFKLFQKKDNAAPASVVEKFLSKHVNDNRNVVQGSLFEVSENRQGKERKSDERKNRILQKSFEAQNFARIT